MRTCTVADLVQVRNMRELARDKRCTGDESHWLDLMAERDLYPDEISYISFLRADLPHREAPLGI